MILTTNSWPDLRRRLEDVNHAVNNPGRDQVTELDIR